MAKEEEKKTVKVAEGEKTKSSEKQEGTPEAESLANVTWQRDSGRLSRPQSTQRVHNVTGGPATNTPGGEASEGEEEQNNSQERGRSRPPIGLSVPSSKTDKKNPHRVATITLRRKGTLLNCPLPPTSLLFFYLFSRAD